MYARKKIVSGIGVAGCLLVTCIEAKTDIFSFDPIESYATKETPIPKLSFDELFQHANQLFAQEDYDEAIVYYKQALALRSTCPQVFFNLGLAHIHQKKYDAAIHAFRQAIANKPNYSKAHAQLGKVLHKLSRTDEAIEHYRTALQYSPGLVEAAVKLARIYFERHQFTQMIDLLKRARVVEPENRQLLFELANTYNTVNRLHEALSIYKKLLARHPNHTAFLYNTAYTLKKMGRIEEALPLYNKALQLDPNHCEAHFSRGLAYLVMGDFERGWSGYEWRWQRPKYGSKRSYPQPCWDGSPLDGKKIFLHAEQGLGDTFQFVRYAQVAKERGGYVIVAVQSPLVYILSLCPYIDQVISLNDTPPPFDLHAPLMSLPHILKTMFVLT